MSHIDDKVSLFYDVENLRPESMYNFRARAQNSVGFSEWSDCSSPMFTAIAVPPEKMQPPLVSNVTPRSRVLRWESPNDGGLPIRGFRVYRFNIIKNGESLDTD